MVQVLMSNIRYRVYYLFCLQILLSMSIWLTLLLLLFHTQEYMHVFGVYSTSQPHEILKAHLSKILDAVTEPYWLANDLSSVDLISGPVADYVLNTLGLSRYNKASRLLEEYQCVLIVFNDIEKLVSFCTVPNKQDSPVLTLVANEISKFVIFTS